MRVLSWSLGLLGAITLIPLPDRADAQAVGAEFQVNTYTTSNQGTYPYGAHLVASDASGKFVVVWSGRGSGDVSGVFGQRYDSAGVRVGAEFRVNSYTTGPQAAPSVVAAADGDFVVVWAGQGQGDSFGIFGRRYDSAGNAIGGEFRVNSYTSGGQAGPSAAGSIDGSFVVAWGGSGQDDEDGVFGQRYDSEGMPQGSEFRVNATTSGLQFFPSAASDATGNFVVVWQDYEFFPSGASGANKNFGSVRQDHSENRHLPYEIFGQRYDRDGVALGGEFQVAGNVSQTVSVASAANGNFVVVWDSYNDGGDFGIRGQRYDSDGVPQGGEFIVNSYTTEYQFRPSVAMDASGNFVVAWDDYGQPEDSWGVFARRFDSAGVAQGSDFQVNSYTYFIQQHPSVGATGNNQFVVTWESFNFTEDGQDGSGSGVFGRRFAFGERITVKSPNTNVRWRIGSLQRIQWTHNLGPDPTFRIELDRTNDGSYEELIAAAVPASSPTRGTFTWTVTGPPSGMVRVRVSWTDNVSVFDVSDVTFQIRPGGLNDTESSLQR